MSSAGRDSPFASYPEDQYPFVHPEDLENRYSRMSFHGADAHPPSVHSASTISVDGRDYIYLAYKRSGDDWYQATTSEIPAPQGELERRVRKNKGKTLPQLEKMGEGRRKQIQQMAAELTAQEVGNVYWEPAYIRSTDETKSRDGKLKVKAFKVVFARQTRKPEASPPPPSPPRKSAEKVTVKQAAPPPQKPAEKPKEKPKQVRRASDLNDVFGLNRIFGQDGHPMDPKANIPVVNRGLREGIAPEKPIGFKPPPAIPLPEADAKDDNKDNDKAKKGNKQQPVPVSKNDLVDINALLGGLGVNDSNYEEAAAEPEVIDAAGVWQPDTDKASRRRSSMKEGRRYLPSTKRYPYHHYSSSRSSFTSDGSSAIVSELDDGSSRASDETRHSWGRGPGERVYKLTTPRKYRRESRYYREISVADSRPRRQAAIEAKPETAGMEQPIRPEHAQEAQRPIVHQQQAQLPGGNSLPTAEYPDYYRRREQERTQNAQDYMLNQIREEDNRAYERDLAQNRRDTAYRESFYDNGYAAGSRRRWTFDPREQHYFPQR